MGLLLFSFRGRISRAKFWLVILLYAMVSMIVQGVSILTGQTTGLFSIPKGTGFIAVVILVKLAMLVPILAVAIKRLHDRNKSAWWLLLFYLVVPVLGVSSLF